MFKGFTIYPRKERKSENSPQYDVYVSIKKPDGETEYRHIGVAWTRFTKKGESRKYLSVKLNEPYVSPDKLKYKKGYAIVEIDPKMPPSTPEPSVFDQIDEAGAPQPNAKQEKETPEVWSEELENW